MLLQLVLVGAATVGATYYRATMDYRKLKPYLKKWEKFIEATGIKNKTDETFTPIDVCPMENGVVYVINIPAALKVEKLEEIKNEMNTYFKGVTTIKRVKFANYCIIKIITKDILDYEFKPVKCTPTEIYVGKTLALEDYKIDLTKGPAHLLICAPSGKGKSFLLATILTNLIYNSSKQIEIYLLQIMKSDVALFKACKCVKYSGFNLEDVTWGLEKLVEISAERDKKFSTLGVKNLKHYNEHYPKSKMKRIFAITEEISFFMENSTDTEEVKNLKARCYEAFMSIVKASRSSGVHLITVTQRSTVDNIPSTMKSMMCRISLGQLSAIDSRNIIESDSAIYLESKECIVYGDKPGEEIIKIPTVDEDFKILNKYVPEIKLPAKSIKEIENKTPEKSKINEEESVTNSIKDNVIPLIPKTDNNGFMGPEFKILNLEAAIDKIDKKIENRKGVYREED